MNFNSELNKDKIIKIEVHYSIFQNFGRKLKICVGEITSIDIIKQIIYNIEMQRPETHDWKLKYKDLEIDGIWDENGTNIY